MGCIAHPVYKGHLLHPLPSPWVIHVDFDLSCVRRQRYQNLKTQQHCEKYSCPFHVNLLEPHDQNLINAHGNSATTAVSFLEASVTTPATRVPLKEILLNMLLRPPLIGGIGTVSLIGSHVQAVGYSWLLKQSIATVSFSASVNALVLSLSGNVLMGLTAKLELVSAQ